MRTITKQYNLYKYEELNEKAKEKVKEWYLDDYTRSDIFYEDIKYMLAEKYPKSDLDVTYSLSYCQGDGLNIFGELNLYDFVDYWQATEKEKRRILFYLEKSYSTFNFETNLRYSYSCKFIDKKYIQDDIDEFIENLEYCQLKNIGKQTISKFFYDMIDHFAELDGELEKAGYDFYYNVSEEELQDYCDCNEYEFYENGKLVA